MKKIIHFLKYRYYAYGLSSLLLVGFLTGTFIFGGFTWGIDFSGGVKITAEFSEEVNPNDIRNVMDKNGVNANVQQIGKDELNEYIISTKLLGKGETSEASSEKIKKILAEEFKNIKLLGVETVGPAIGKFLRKSAMKLGLIAIVLMLIYLAFRFELKYSAGVMAAVLHDVVLSLFFCGIMKVEINVPIIAAILTIFGFSVNDTIVIFDRVRENIQVKSKQTFTQVLDVSISQTLSRTILTSLTLLFAIVALYVIGEGTISDFALVMLFGLIIGTYSTIYIASPVVLAWERIFTK